MKILHKAAVQDLLHYTPETGCFSWLVMPNGRVNTGSAAGCLNRDGYQQIQIKGIKYMAHHLAWLFMNNEWPAGEIDHINGIRDDNRISNLRKATREGNTQNQSIRRDNTSGVKGVSWHKVTGKWQGNCQSGGVNHYLGLFSERNDAELAVREFREKKHNEFANHGGSL